MLSNPTFWVGVAFVIFLGVLYYYGVPKTMLNSLDTRSKRIADELAEARRLRQDAERLLKEYEAKRTTAEREAAAMKTRAEEAGTTYEKSLAEARSRAQALAQETRSKLAAESDAKRKALEADLAQRLAQSEATIAARKAEAMSNVRGIAAETAAAIVERLTGRAPAPGAVDAALDDVRA